MNWKNYKNHIGSKNVKIRQDVTPIFENPKIFHNLIADMIKPFRKTSYNKIVALDALGFVLGSAIAYKTKKSLVLIRKRGKLPYPNKFLESINFTDYTKSKKGFDIKKGSLNKKDRVLIVDEWIQTGTQAKSAIKLIEKLGAKIIGISTINTDLNKKTEILFEKYNCKSLNN
ncbi:hypothetical protein HOA55_05190 [archaeon]|jgi:adenine phosphoribosyltransferase|nr:hypothetical protein [archaeon]MBT3577716.1 hypothetical protein [archaeon]MBT6820723.1 hypothetical protein [archaeon]MBT6955905.1 hypothetical protein [archaeon]MBT7025863.1 hypothetical protein [archaeon]